LPGNDILESKEGNDILDGGVGIDTMSGGLGDDVYKIDHGLDSIFEFLGEGKDTVFTSVDYVLSENVEDLILVNNLDINGTGNSLKNTIQGNDTNNTLSGEAGNDRIQGGAGDDGLDGGEGDDVLEGGDGKDSLVGNIGDDLLSGGAGKDRLTGGGGVDRFVLAMSGKQADVVTDFIRNEGDQLIISTKDLGVNLRKGKLSAKQFILGFEAVDANDRLIYQASTGKLFFDVDGIGKTQKVQLATLPQGTALRGSDIFVTA
jgi:Ca2+-binding RTX toxin-like protein